MTVPAAYLVPNDLVAVLALLDAHGVKRQPVPRPMRHAVERFIVDSTTVAGREYQGHTERTLFGRYEQVEIDVTSEMSLVPVAQPLARLIVALLEPRSDDGMVNWNVLDDALDGARYYPILRVPAPKGQ